MEIHHLHDWQLTPEQARAVQVALAERVRLEPLDIDSLTVAAGCDCSFKAGANQDRTQATAGFVSLTLPDLRVIERAGARTTVDFPYIPGLFSFREIPPLLEAWQHMEKAPDAILCDGQGLAHPRRFGLACHLGLLLDIPAVGVAKSLLVGTHEPVPDEAGAWKPLVHRGEIVGAALRTRAGAAPVFVSPGHRIDLISAIKLVLKCVTRYRQPETTRHAHRFVGDLRIDPATPAHEVY